MAMEIKIEQVQNVRKIKIAGEIILSEAIRLKNSLEDLKGVSEIHFDLSEVSYANSSFLNWLLNLKKEFPGIAIKIINPNDFLLELLSVMGFKRFFEIVTEK
jgi:anti-anti-sigma factor